MKEVVEAGYDAIARTYLTWSAQIADDPRLHYLEEFDSRLETGAKVLELGCGAGVPVTRRLAERHDVLGVDLSQQQIDLARTNVRGARFEKADMTALDFPDHTFDGIAAFYSILHVPRAEQPELIAKIARWLKPGGLFLASLGTGTPDVTETWLGVEMFFGQLPARPQPRAPRRAPGDRHRRPGDHARAGPGHVPLGAHTSQRTAPTTARTSSTSRMIAMNLAVFHVE